MDCEWSFWLLLKVQEKLSEKSGTLDFPYLTRRQLLQHRKLLRRAIARGRNIQACEELEIKIDEEVAARRDLRIANASKDVPEIY